MALERLVVLVFRQILEFLGTLDSLVYPGCPARLDTLEDLEVQSRLGYLETLVVLQITLDNPVVLWHLEHLDTLEAHRLRLDILESLEHRRIPERLEGLVTPCDQWDQGILAALEDLLGILGFLECLGNPEGLRTVLEGPVFPVRLDNLYYLLLLFLLVVLELLDTPAARQGPLNILGLLAHLGILGHLAHLGILGLLGTLFRL